MDDRKNFCRHCGHPLGVNASYCEGCGRRVDRRGRLAWIIGGMLLVALAGLAGGYFWGKTGADRWPPPSLKAPSTPAAGKVVSDPAPPPAREIPPEPQAKQPWGEPEESFAALPPLDSRPEEFSPLPPPPSLVPPEKAPGKPLPPAKPAGRTTPAATGSGANWPWTSQRPVTQEDLSRLTPGELELMRNEIFARHGWVFKRADLQAHFDKQPWYRPSGSAANREAANRLAEAALTPLERQNIQVIAEFEKLQAGRR